MQYFEAIFCSKNYKQKNKADSNRLILVIQFTFHFPQTSLKHTSQEVRRKFELELYKDNLSLYKELSKQSNLIEKAENLKKKELL